MNHIGIETKVGILGGKPVIAGTRIPVELIMDLLSSGLTASEIQGEYPHLSKGQIQAAISYAASAIRRETVVPIETKNGKVVFYTA